MLLKSVPGRGLISGLFCSCGIWDKIIFQFTAVGLKADWNDTPEPPDDQNDQNNGVKDSDVRRSGCPHPEGDATEPVVEPGGDDNMSVPKWCLCIFLVLLIAGGVLVVVIVGATVKPRYWIPPEVSRKNYNTFSDVSLSFIKITDIKLRNRVERRLSTE